MERSRSRFRRGRVKPKSDAANRRGSFEAAMRLHKNLQ
jgi:hypothetical protein